MADIICCYTTYQDEVHQAIERYANDTTLIPVDGDPWAYWRGMSLFWCGREDLVNIEHDIVIGPDTISSLLECSEPWCVFGYQHGCPPPSHGHLGCVKFSAELQQVVPARMMLQPDCPYCTPPELCWMHLDNTIERVLRENGYPQAHYHGDVTHLQWAFRKMSDHMTEDMKCDYGFHTKLTIIRERGEFNAADYLQDHPPGHDQS